MFSRSSIRLLSTISLLLVTVAARAQEAPPPPQQEPQQQQPAPPMPPRWTPYPVYPPPYALPPPPSLDELAMLEQAGHHKKIAGIALMASGGGLLVVGTALSIAGSWNSWNGNWYDCHHESCGNTALQYAGASTAIAGSVALFTGVPVYLIGVGQVQRAQALRRRRMCYPSIGMRSRGAVVGLASSF